MRAIVLLAALAAAVTARAAEEAAEPAAPAAPAIEVVRDGGVAEAWRDEGSEFATFGPDGDAVVPTIERQALQALANAYDVHLVRLKADDEVIPGTLAICTTKSDCIDGRLVLARVPGDTIPKHRLARAVAVEALEGARPEQTADAPVFRHALQYTSDGHAWTLLLCFECGRYALRRDGEDVGAGRSGGATQRAQFDALLVEAAQMQAH